MDFDKENEKARARVFARSDQHGAAVVEQFRNADLAKLAEIIDMLDNPTPPNSQDDWDTARALAKLGYFRALESALPSEEGNG